MGYAATTVVIMYWNPYETFAIHRAHNILFDEYNYLLSIKYNHTPGYLLLQQDTESNVHNLDLLNLIRHELDLTSTLFCDTNLITHEI